MRFSTPHSLSLLLLLSALSPGSTAHGIPKKPIRSAVYQANEEMVLTTGSKALVEWESENPDSIQIASIGWTTDGGEMIFPRSSLLVELRGKQGMEWVELPQYQGEYQSIIIPHGAFFDSTSWAWRESMIQKMIDDSAFRHEVRARADAGDSKYHVLVGLMNTIKMDQLCDPEIGVQWLTKAAESGDPWGMTELAFTLLFHEQPSPQQIESSKRWLQKACLTNYPHGWFGLGAWIALCDEAKTEQMIENYTKASELGDKDAIRMLLNVYARSNVIPTNSDIIIDLKIKLAYQGDKSEMFHLAKWNLVGEYVEQNIELGTKLMRQAAERGHSDAQMIVQMINHDSLARAITFLTRADGTYAGEEREFKIVDGVQMMFCWIPAGTFQMGSPANELGRVDTEGPVRDVRITCGFWLGKYLVTQGEWLAVMKNNPSHFNKQRIESNTLLNPVENVSWFDICGDESRNEAFLGKVNQYAPYGWRFDLPTEAQWEYACRAGTQTSLNNGTNITVNSGNCASLSSIAWYNKNSNYRTFPVGMKKANAWGLHDMHGHVFEWCRDRHQNSYEGLEIVDPTGPTTGNFRIIRGGSSFSEASACRAAYRNGHLQRKRHFNLGFRLALVPAE